MVYRVIASLFFELMYTCIFYYLNELRLKASWGGVLAIFCFSVIHAKLCHFRQYVFMHQREDRIAYFETNGYLNRDIGEARNLFIKKIALVSPPITKYLENKLFSVSFFQGQHIYFQIVPPPPIRIIQPSPKIQIDKYSN